MFKSALFTELHIRPREFYVVLGGRGVVRVDLKLFVGRWERAVGATITTNVTKNTVFRVSESMSNLVRLFRGVENPFASSGLKTALYWGTSTIMLSCQLFWDFGRFAAAQFSAKVPSFSELSGCLLTKYYYYYYYYFL